MTDEKIIILGDTHWKEREPYLSSLKQFFKDLAEKHSDATLIQSGDFFDSSSQHLEEVVDVAAEHIARFKKVHIVDGNHEHNRIKGNILRIFNRLPNIQTYPKPTEVQIGKYSFLFLPHLGSARKMKEQYEKIEWEGDYCIPHCAYPGKNRGSIDELNLEKIKAVKLYGHIHPPEHIDDYNIQIGVPVPTRYGEHLWTLRYFELTDKLREHKIKKYFDFEDLEYGEIPSNTNNVLCIKNAPSIQAIYEKYGEYLIHNDKCELLRTSVATNYDTQKSSLNMSLEGQFDSFCQEDDVDIDEDVRKKILEYL